MPHDYWTTRGNYWYVYLTVTSVVCWLYTDEKGAANSNCTQPYDISRFHAYRRNYVLMLDVKNASITDAGLYVCAQPPVYSMLGELGLIAIVGIVCESLALMKKFIRHAGSNTNITMTMSMQRQICT